MSATTKRIVDKARRDAVLTQAVNDLWDAYGALEDALPLGIGQTDWPHIHACRKALTAATVALDAIETQMPSENRRGR
jgi:hypothetical protein